MLHPSLPLAVATTRCPMLAWKDPRCQTFLLLYDRVKRWNRLPAAGGLDDQNPRELAALELIDEVLATPDPQAATPVFAWRDPELDRRRPPGAGTAGAARVATRVPPPRASAMDAWAMRL